MAFCALAIKSKPSRGGGSAKPAGVSVSLFAGAGGEVLRAPSSPGGGTSKKELTSPVEPGRLGPFPDVVASRSASFCSGSSGSDTTHSCAALFSSCFSDRAHDTTPSSFALAIFSFVAVTGSFSSPTPFISSSAAPGPVRESDCRCCSSSPDEATDADDVDSIFLILVPCSPTAFVAEVVAPETRPDALPVDAPDVLEAPEALPGCSR
mmetsp:Transcript_1959/g.4530  ORF Transcript_1959/g.4530 Transcript_1959/m.4530 type:complete len:208 (+) Transcript_1959:514-1137(+)